MLATPPQSQTHSWWERGKYSFANNDETLLWILRRHVIDVNKPFTLSLTPYLSPSTRCTCQIFRILSLISRYEISLVFQEQLAICIFHQNDTRSRDIITTKSLKMIISNHIYTDAWWRIFYMCYFDYDSIWIDDTKWFIMYERLFAAQQQTRQDQTAKINIIISLNTH